MKNDLFPQHIAIIMDGNGRWAKKRNMHRGFGHKAGMEKVIEIVQHASNIGVKILTLYAFSTENWKRPQEEINGLMNLLVVYIRNQLKKLCENNVKLKIIGDISPLPSLAKNELIRAIESTKNNDGMILNIAINYGGRDEILRAVKEICSDVIKSKLEIDNLSTDIISSYLYTRGLTDPDLIIRPGQEQRISNFLIYQAAYSELYFTDVLWPDFGSEELDKAIEEYKNRTRRFGGI